MISPLATPAEVAEVLHTITGTLAQMRYRGGGPKFVRLRRKRVLYRGRRGAVGRRFIAQPHGRLTAATAVGRKTPVCLWP